MIQINIPMPNNCYDCPFSDDSGDYPYVCQNGQNNQHIENHGTMTMTFGK